VVHVGGGLDLVTSGQLRSDMSKFVGARSAFVLDLTEVPFVDSIGISALLATRSAALEHGGSLVVRNPTNVVRRALELTGLDGLLIEPS